MHYDIIVNQKQLCSEQISHRGKRACFCIVRYVAYVDFIHLNKATVVKSCKVAKKFSERLTFAMQRRMLLCSV